MSCRIGIGGALAAALAVAAAPQPAAAGDFGAFAAGTALGVLGTLATQQARQPQRTVVERHYVTRQAPQVSSYQREDNRRVQTALNYFGFPAGVPDGVLGANSRSAIGQYQAFLGYAPTGYLDEYQRGFLTASYDRAIVGGAATAQTMATMGQGTRGLLVAYRQEQAGVPVAPATPVAPPPVAVAPPAAPAAPAAPAPGVVEAAASADAGDGGKAALPTFIAGPAAPSMAAACNHTSLATSKNGGPVVYKVGATLDALQAIDEQFCLARTYAISDGESLAATAQSFTASEIEEQCTAFAPTMRGFVGKLVNETPKEATADLTGFVASTGIPPAQLSANARICLGVGYSTDNPDVALASALVLVGLGEGAYDELVAYHLINGYGTAARGTLGVDWLNAALDALENGAEPIVTVDEENRFDLLQTTAALLMVGETEATIAAPQDASAPGGAPGAGAPTEASAPAAMALPKPVAKAVSN